MDRRLGAAGRRDTDYAAKAVRTLGAERGKRRGRAANTPPAKGSYCFVSGVGVEVGASGVARAVPRARRRVRVLATRFRAGQHDPPLYGAFTPWGHDDSTLSRDAFSWSKGAGTRQADRDPVVGLPRRPYPADLEAHKHQDSLQEVAQLAGSKKDSGFPANSAECLSSLRWPDNTPPHPLLGILCDSPRRQQRGGLQYSQPDSAPEEPSQCAGRDEAGRPAIQRLMRPERLGLTPSRK